jgi:hypothetical protein
MSSISEKVGVNSNKNAISRKAEREHKISS